MRTLLYAILIVLSVSLLSAQSLGDHGNFNDADYSTPQDTTSLRLFQRGGAYAPSIGVFRVCVIFVDREGTEAPSTNEWPSPGNPTYQNCFIENSNINPLLPDFQWSSDINITKYMWEMSCGAFKFVGDVYRFTLPQVYPPSVVSTSYGGLNRYIIESLDNRAVDPVDFSLYDNWTINTTTRYNHINQPDGIADMVFIVYRSPLNGVRQEPPVNYYGPVYDYSGFSGLSMSYLSNDYNSNGQQVTVSNGTTQGSCKSGHVFARDLILHEFGHKLIPGGIYGHTGRIANLGLLNANQVGWNCSKGMCAWERELLNWIDYTSITSDTGANGIMLNDMITNNGNTPYALKISTSDPDKYYVIENRQGFSNFDEAYDKGIYIYRISEKQELRDNGVSFYYGINSRNLYNPRNVPEPDGYGCTTDGYYDGLVNVLSADGRWNFVNNLNSSYEITNLTDLRVTKTEPNPKGYDERDYCGSLKYWNTFSSPPAWKWTRYYCLYDSPSNKLWYLGDIPNVGSDRRGDAFGDQYDAFSIEYNKVFSKWSNPGIEQAWATSNFSVEILPPIPQDPRNGEVRVRVRFSNPHLAPLARPMGLDGDTDNGISYALHWHQPNTELQPGFQSYELYHRRNTTTAWNLIASTTDQNVNLSIPYVGNPNIVPIHKRNYFKVRAVKASPGGESNFSDEIKIVNNDIIIPNYSIPSGKTLSIDDSLTVRVTGSLELQANSGLLLGRGSRLIVQEGASLVIGSNCQVKGTNKSIGTETGSAVVINGSVSVGTSVTFSSDVDCWEGLIIDSATQANLIGVSFNNADLVTYSDATVEACAFSNCIIKQYARDLTISSSTFNSASIKSVAKLEDSSINIVSSQFTGSSNLDAIGISSMSKYAISGNYISGYRTALAIYESMNGSIEANEIVGNGTGIQLYHAVADIYNGNTVQNNDYGIVALRNSLWSLQGSKEAPYQFVTDNASCQVLFTYDSAPEYMEFNHIYSTNNSDKAFVVCDKVPSDPKKILIANNYFGTMFDPFKNLIPTEIFIYDPVWEPDPATLNVSIIPAMYKTAKDYQRMSDYDSAQALWHQYYSAVPDSSILFDKTVKQLLSVEKLSSDNYTQLLAFYGTAATDDPISIRLLSYMSNYCLIEGNDLQSAILWLESQIENPVTEVDSLFAAIDIGYLYTIIDANKAPIHGKMPWLKPTSMQAYENNRNNAIMSLINGQSSAQPISQSSLPTASLLRNYPNPFNPSTTISFNLPSVMSCKLEIYNLKGQRVITLLNEARASGSHTITWSGLDDAGRPVSSGLYFYRLTTPQNIVSAKMLMLK